MSAASAAGSQLSVTPSAATISASASASGTTINATSTIATTKSTTTLTDVTAAAASLTSKVSSSSQLQNVHSAADKSAQNSAISSKRTLNDDSAFLQSQSLTDQNRSTAYVPAAEVRPSALTNGARRGSGGFAGGAKPNHANRADQQQHLDLSTLNASERAVIESVMKRQQEEEQRNLEARSKNSNEIAKATLDKPAKTTGSGTDTAFCEVCRKTQFVDGAGKLCHNCKLKTCMRCGSLTAITPQTNKVVWLCNNCKKSSHPDATAKFGDSWPTTNFNSNNYNNTNNNSNNNNNGSTTSSPSSSVHMISQRANAAATADRYAVRGQAFRKQYSVGDPAGAELHQYNALRAADSERLYETRGGSGMRPGSPSVADLAQNSRRSSVSSNRQQVANSQQSAHTNVLYPAQHLAPGPTSLRGPHHHHHHHKNRQMQRRMCQSSLSSSDDEMCTTPELNSCDEFGLESEPVYGRPGHVYNPLRSASATPLAFQRRPDAIDSRVRKLLSHPVTWQVSASGTHLIGHMILKKLSSQQDDTTGSGSDSGAILGLKIIGGKMTANGRLGAFVTKVKTGSAADLVGRLKPGDEVLEWNGRSLQGLTLEEVYDVVIESKNDSQVELVVQRDLRQGGMIDAPSTRHRQSAVAANSAYANDMYPLREHFAAQGRADAGIDSIAAPPTGYAGRIQIKLLYDTKNLLLIVSVLSAATLRLARTTVAYNRQQFPYLVNAYCKLYLLPDRSERSRRRSKTVLRSNDPKWNQTFFYTPIRDSDIYSRVLEVSVWDYDRRNGSELVGVCEIELATAELHDAARWYYLSFPDPASYWATYGEADTSAEDVRGYPNIRYSSTPYVNQPGSASSAAFIPPSSETGHRRSTTATGNSYLMCPPRGVDSAPTSPPDAYAGSVYAPLSASNADASLQAPSMRRTRDTFRKMHMHSASLDYDNTDRLNVYAPRSNAHSPSPSMYGREASNRSQAYDQRDFEDRRLSPASRVAGAPRNLASPAPSEPVYAEPFGRQVNFPSSMAQSNSSRTLTPPRQRILPQVPQTSRQQFAANAQLDSRRLAESAPSASTGAIKPGRSRSRTGDRRLDGDNLNSDNSETSGISEASKLSALSLRSSDVQRQQVSNIYPYAKAEIQVDERVERHRGQRTYAQYGRSASVEVDKPYAGEASGNDELNWSRVSDSGMDSTQTLPGQQRSRPNVMQDDQAKAYDNTPKSAEGDVQSESTSVTATSRSAMQPEGDANEAQQTPSISETSSQTGSVSTPKKQSGMTRKISSLVNLGKKSSSVSQLAETKNGRTSFQRSEEIGNALENDRSTLASASSTQKLSQSKKTSFGLGSMDDFIDGLGPGQVVGRQVLGSPCLGEIQIGLFERKGHLEVEVIRARNLVSKTFSKTLPNVYVKLYLMDKKTCVEKQKISSQQKSLEPRYQQTVTFMESYQNRLLQIMLWGDYGRMERKVFMGVAQVHVADLDLSTVTIGWYKLYNANSLVTGPPAMAQRASSTSVVNQTGDR